MDVPRGFIPAEPRAQAEQGSNNDAVPAGPPSQPSSISSTQRIVLVCFPGHISQDGKQVAHVVCKLVVASVLGSAEPGTENAKRGKYTIRTPEEKAFIIKFVDFFKRDKKVGAAKALQVIGEAHAQFKGVSKRSVRDWRAADALIAEKQKLDAVDEEMQNAEDTAAPNPARGRPTLVSLHLRELIKSKVRVSSL